MAQAVSSPTQVGTLRHGVWLTVARAAWIVLTVLVLIGTVVAAHATVQQIHVICTLPRCTGMELPRNQAHALRQLGVTLDAYAVYSAVELVVFAFTYIAVAAVIFWRKSDDRLGLLAAFALVLFGGLTVSAGVVLIEVLPPAAQLPVRLLALIGDLSILLLAYLFPDGRLVLRWPLLLGIPWAVLQTNYLLVRNSALDLYQGPPLLVILIWTAAIGSFIYVQIYRYRKVSTPTERQQTKWVVYGSAVDGAGYVITALIVMQFAQLAINPVFLVARGTLLYFFLLLLPISLGIAILRYRLWDVDLLINRTLVYGLLTALLVVLYLGSVVLLEAVFRAVTGQGSNLSIAISTLAIAALFQPLRRGIQSFIDRRFYRRKYDTARTLAAFSAAMRDEVDLDRLTHDLMAVVQDTMQPAHVSLWLR